MVKPTEDIMGKPKREKPNFSIPTYAFYLFVVPQYHLISTQFPAKPSSKSLWIRI